MMQKTKHEMPDVENVGAAQITTSPAASRGAGAGPWRGLLPTCLLTCLLTAALGATGAEQAPADEKGRTVRLAVFNVWELSATKIDTLDEAGMGADPQLLSAAEIIRRVRPDILLLNEIDYSPDRPLARQFVERYLLRPQDGPLPIDYPYIYAGPVNTGIDSGLDLDNDGRVGGPNDAWGFGRYPGQYGMALLSRLPIDLEGLRSFRAARWITMPGHLIPDGRQGRPAWYSEEEAAVLRLSSKSFWDVPIEIGDRRLHILASHPTPPVFDGDEDRNGRRNFDEIRMVADYLRGGREAAWMADDRGRRGGLDRRAPCVVMGDLNADPVSGQADYGKPAIAQLLSHPRLRDPEPKSPGDLGTAAGRQPYGGDSRTRTSGYGRIDYLLPSRDLRVIASGIFLPEEGDPLRRLVVGEQRASDHLLVWSDISMEKAR